MDDMEWNGMEWKKRTTYLITKMNVRLQKNLKSHVLRLN